MFCGWQSSATRNTLRPLGLLEALAQDHGFRRGGGFVQEGGVGDLHPGKVAHHRLESEHRFESALGDLGLVRRVLGVPARVFENVALDNRRRDAIVVAHPEIGTADLVPDRHPTQALEGFRFAGGVRQVERSGEPNPGGDSRIDQRGQRGEAEGLQHLALPFRVRPDVAVNKMVRVRFQAGRREHR